MGLVVSAPVTAMVDDAESAFAMPIESGFDSYVRRA
jgi:hypothetical protein